MVVLGFPDLKCIKDHTRFEICSFPSTVGDQRTPIAHLAEGWGRAGWRRMEKDQRTLVGHKFQNSWEAPILTKITRVLRIASLKGDFLGAPRVP